MTDGAVFESCIYDDSGDAPAEFLNVTNPRARKEYTCCECRMPIKVGEVYERAVGKWDGEIDTVCTCMVCANVRASLFKGAFVYGGMWEAIRDELEDGQPVSEDEDESDEDWLIGPRLANRR